MKKITALLLIFALALCLLTACGEKSEEKDTTEESVTQVTEIETDVPEITVTVDLIVAVFEARGYSVFDEGEIVQYGEHDTLVEETDGKYFELWNAQAQYYNEEQQ